MTKSSKLKALEHENYCLKYCVEMYYKSQQPLLMEVSRLKEIVANLKENNILNMND